MRRVLGAPDSSVEAFSKTVDALLQQHGEPEKLPFADIDTAIEMLQGGCPPWLDVLGFQAHCEKDGFERAIRLIASGN